MKLPSLLVLLAAASVHAEITTGILFCQARVYEGDPTDLSIEIPTTSGYVDANGNPAAIWRIGAVVAGGASDTFYSNEGPGAFSARNTGSCAAYLYITSGYEPSYGNSEETDKHMISQSVYNYIEISFNALFGDGSWFLGECVPNVASMGDNENRYRLAISTAVSSKVPEWRPLCWWYGGSGEWIEVQQSDDSGDWYNSSCGQYLCYLLPGEVQPFDLKFWAPRMGAYSYSEKSLVFPVFVEASTFRRWDHDK